jgi:copper(I)-binding protein
VSSSLRRGALAASAIVFSIASLAACGAGNDSQTLEIKPDNAATSVGNIKIQNALVITQPDAKVTGPVAIAATLFNTGNTDQTLQSISVPGAGTAQLKPAKGQSLTVPSHGSLVVGGKDNASALIATGGEAIKNGNAQKVTFTFSETGAVNIQAFVVPATSYFSKWGPSEIPAAPSAPATSPTATATGTAAAGATSSAGGKPAKGDKTSPSATATGATPSDSASQSAAGH